MLVSFTMRAHGPDTSRNPPLAHAGALALFPLWFALAGTFTEVLIVYLKKHAQPLMLLSGDFVWMAPVALLTVIATVTVATSALARMWRPRPARALGLFASVSLVLLNVLLLVPGLAHYASAVLAAGLGVQVTRVVLARPESVRRLMRGTAVWMLGLLVVAGASMRSAMQPDTAAAMAAVAPPGSPNLLFITLDAVRAANLGTYGYARRTMPAIDRFARRGVVFEDALATAPWTLPSHASLFTGRWPHELSADHASPLDDRDPTLAGYLRERGYSTGGFVANLKYCGVSTGLARGFNVYEDYPRSVGEMAASSTLIRSVADNFRLRRLIENDQHLNRVSAEDINTRALAWISTKGRSPFFAFLNYFDAHEPYLPPPPYDRQFGPGRESGRHSPLHHWLWNPAVGHGPMEAAVVQEEIDAYDGSLAYLDRNVGALLDELDRRGVLSNTVVVITADHGEEFAEHAVYEHGYSLYRASVQVPLIVVAPGRAPSGRRVPTPVSLRDVAATVADLLTQNTHNPFPGASLVPLWRAGTTESPADLPTLSPLFAEVNPSPGQPGWFPSSKGPMKAIVHGGLRFIRNGDGSEELYDFTADPWERTNLAVLPERQPALAEARAALERLLRGSGGR